jgi:hypothetical protein
MLGHDELLYCNDFFLELAMIRKKKYDKIHASIIPLSVETECLNLIICVGVSCAKVKPINAIKRPNRKIPTILSFLFLI